MKLRIRKNKKSRSTKGIGRTATSSDEFSCVKMRTLTSGVLRKGDNTLWLNGEIDTRSSDLEIKGSSSSSSEPIAARSSSSSWSSTRTSGTADSPSSSTISAPPSRSASFTRSSTCYDPPPPPDIDEEAILDMIRKNPPPNQSYTEAYERFMKSKAILDELMNNSGSDMMMASVEDNEAEEEDLEYFFKYSQPEQQTTKEYGIMKSIISKLSDEEKEIAAKADYQYYRLARQQELSGLPPTELQQRAFEDAIMGQMERFLVSNRLKEKATLEAFRKSLDFRKEFHINAVRFCFMDNPTSLFSKIGQVGVQRYIGDVARAIVLNYDELGHANLYLTGRFNRYETRADLEGFLGSHGYMFERAIAATIHKTQGKRCMVNTILDFHGFGKKNAQPMYILTELLKLMNQQYPRRIHRAYLVDPPFIARFAYRIVKPIVSATGLAQEVIFVNGEKERKSKLFGLDPLCTEGIDIHKYYTEIPFHQTYSDVFPIQQETQEDNV